VGSFGYVLEGVLESSYPIHRENRRVYKVGLTREGMVVGVDEVASRVWVVW
jgi:hypothetical protein